MPEIKAISNAEPLHIGQNKINRALFDYLAEKYLESKGKAGGGLVQFRFNSEFIRSEKLLMGAASAEQKSGAKAQDYFYEV